MCGRYALGIRLAVVRHQLQQQGLQVDEAPNDDEVRESYNFAPGYNGPVYRADTTDHGDLPGEASGDAEDADTGDVGKEGESSRDKPIKYKLQSMKWGLVPFWTKRSPDYGSLMRTINCRDDSLIEDRGMWTSMKRKKRCIVVCQGFYEWLKKGPGGKEKIPHFIRRKDQKLMCFAGLWDCVKYEGSDEKLYTYTVITTSSNPYLKFLHDRMPVILDPDSPEMKTWLDPRRKTWSKELQSILKPYEGELECYPVSKEVGKVGNNSPDFLVPINSKENKKNIANFFGNAQKAKAGKTTTQKDAGDTAQKAGTIKHEEGEGRETKDVSRAEDNAPLPVPKEENKPASSQGLKREHSAEDDMRPSKVPKSSQSPTKASSPSANRKTRSATSNGSATKGGTPKKAEQGTQRITNFFKK